MNFKQIALVPCLLLGFLLACDRDPGPDPLDGECIEILPSPSFTKILPLGDSRVQGAPPAHESYRYELWKLFQENSWEVDFIGTKEDLGAYPPVNSRCFDGDHEGTGGASSGDIVVTLEFEEIENEADVVLLGIGGNDILDGAMPMDDIYNNIRGIINRLQSANPNVFIFIEQIAPGRSDIMTPELSASFEALNAEIPTIAAELTNNNSIITVINMANDWSDSFMADDVHYNENGAREVARRYYEAIERLVPK